MVAAHRAAWFAPTYKLLREAWREALHLLAPVITRVNAAEGRVEVSTGGSIEFWTLIDRNAGRGRKYHRVVVDEAAHAGRLQDVWEQSILPALADFRGEAMLSSTPCGMNYFYELWTRGRSGDADWASFTYPTSSNPRIAPAEIESQRAILPSLTFAQEFEGAFVSMRGGILREEHLIAGAADASLPRYVGVDLAVSQKDSADYTAIAVIAPDSRTGKIYIEQVQRGRWTFAETIDRIKTVAEDVSPVVVGVESVQYQAAVVQELLRTTRLPARAIHARGDKLARFSGVIARAEAGLLRVNPTGVPRYAVEEICAFPAGAHDDCVDAVSCAWEAAQVWRRQSARVEGLPR